MPQNATPKSTLAELKPAQQRAVISLALGRTVTDAATEAGVDRATTYRWLSEPVFRATYNQVRADAEDALSSRLTRIATKALDRVETSIDEGDVRVAMSVLRLASNRKVETGPTDPVEIETQQGEVRLYFSASDRAKILAIDE